MTLAERTWRWLSITVTVALTTGCAAPESTSPTPPGLVQAPVGRPAAGELDRSHPVTQLVAWVDPPVGWKIDKFDDDSQHTHVVWLSPSRDTAYGVILIKLPWPIGPDMVLWGFLKHLEAADHSAELVQKERAPDLPGLRFIADSGSYRLRVNLTVRDWRAWAVYAGTRRGHAERPAELGLAELARDRTRVGEASETASAK